MSSIAYLASGAGSTLKSVLLDANIANKITVVISNKHCGAIDIANEHNIKSHVLEHSQYATRESHEDAIHELLLKCRVDGIFLVGYMRILTVNFIQKWQGRIFNIHPAILPSFKGSNAIQDSKNAGALISGSTIHRVVEAVDCGEILVQSAIAVFKNDPLELTTGYIKAIEGTMVCDFLEKMPLTTGVKFTKYINLTIEEDPMHSRNAIINFCW